MMIFGLRNDPISFQRLTKRCNGDLNLHGCLIYLDDVSIFSKDIEDNLDRLDAVFSRLEAYNLKIKPLKCIFKTSTTYLEHLISEKASRLTHRRLM